MKKLLAVGITLSLIIILSFGMIQIVSQGAEIPASEKIDIALIGRNQNKFWQTVKTGAERAAKEYGVDTTFEAPEEEIESQKQLDMLKAAVDKNPQAIVLAAINSKAAIPYLEKAQQKGIEVIGFDSGVNSPIVKTTIASDNYGMGELAAQRMAELIGKKGKVGIVIHEQTSRTGIDRRDGFIDTIRERYSEIEVLPVEYGKTDINESMKAAKRIITAHPDLKGIFGANEEAGYGVIRAVRELGKEGQIKIIGVDSGKELLGAIREGVASGAITQNPISIGYKAIEAAIKEYKGEKNPKFIQTEFKWYDKSNMDTAEIKELIYE